MRKISVRNGVSFGMAVIMATVFMAGCGNAKAAAVSTEPSVATEQTATEAATTEQVATEPVETEQAVESVNDSTEEASESSAYFSKGVYANYAKEAENPPKTYFYVFSADNHGYTADGENNDVGVPFDIVQSDGKVSFTFGGKDESEDVLVITGKENGMIYGHFETVADRELVFEPVSGVDPEDFSAVNYLSAAKGEDLIYRDGNGWSVKYNPSYITVNGGGPVTTFVYTGDCPGTCMITASYGIEMDAKAKAEDLAKSYGDKAIVNETVFPGTEDVKGYYVDAVPGQLGPGLYESAYIRDYMDGYLMFEFTDHVGGDDEVDMLISDTLSAIIDSLSFE